MTVASSTQYVGIPQQNIIVSFGWGQKDAIELCLAITCCCLVGDMGEVHKCIVILISSNSVTSVLFLVVYIFLGRSTR